MISHELEWCFIDSLHCWQVHKLVENNCLEHSNYQPIKRLITSGHPRTPRMEVLMTSRMGRCLVTFRLFITALNHLHSFDFRPLSNISLQAFSLLQREFFAPASAIGNLWKWTAKKLLLICFSWVWRSQITYERIANKLRSLMHFGADTESLRFDASQRRVCSLHSFLRTRATRKPIQSILNQPQSAYMINFSLLMLLFMLPNRDLM